MLVIAVFILLWFCVGACKKVPTLHPYNHQATLPLRGMLAMMIVLHHFVTLYGDRLYWLGDCADWGAPICAVFFFLSGYGLQVSYRNKGIAYLDGFLYKHLVKLFLPILIVGVIHILAGKDPMQPHLWFVWVLILYYVIYYLSYRYIRKDTYKLIAVWMTIPCYICLIMYLGWDKRWWISTPAFAIGLTYPLAERKVMAWLSGNVLHYMTAVMISIIILGYTCISTRIHLLPLSGAIACCTLPLMTALATYRCPLPDCKVSDFLGTISLEIYLVHVGIMLYFGDTVEDNAVFVTLTFGLSVLSAWFVNGICRKINKFINR